MTLPPFKLRLSAVPPPKQPGFAGALQRLLRICLGVGVALMAALFVLLALFTALILGSVLVAWALIRGRRPTVGVFNEVYRRRRRAAGQVVDVEVREVHEMHEARQAPTPGDMPDRRG